MIEGVNSFVSTQLFNGEFYVYTANGPSGNKGYISLVPGATAEKCPAGRTLHATGKKLTPGIHPMGFLLGKPCSSPKILVSVYDSISLLRGFIDPSSPSFSRPHMSALQKPETLSTRVSDTTVAGPVTTTTAVPVVDLSVINAAVDQAVSHALHQAVAEAVSQAMATHLASLPAPVLPVAVAEPVAVAAPEPVAVAAPEPVPVVDVIPSKLLLSTRVSFPAGDYSVIAAEAGSASIGTISNIPGKLAMKVNTSALTENSMIFLTPLGRGPTLVAVSDVQASIGQFTIATGSVCTVNWLIVN